MPVISSEVPGADDELFKSDGNSGVSVLVGKVWKTTSPDGSGAELEDWIHLLFVCLSVCLNTHLLLFFLVPPWETDVEGQLRCGMGRGGQRTVLWNYGSCFFSASKF